MKSDDLVMEGDLTLQDVALHGFFVGREFGGNYRLFKREADGCRRYEVKKNRVHHGPYDHTRIVKIIPGEHKDLILTNGHIKELVLKLDQENRINKTIRKKEDLHVAKLSNL